MLYVPNLIGYFRIACMAASFYYACGCESSPVECEVERSNHRLAIVLYLLNFAGDVVDGYAARLFDQGKKFKGGAATPPLSVPSATRQREGLRCYVH